MKQSSKRSLSLMVAAVGVLVSQSAWAQISDGVVKLGVLNDMSSLYADVSGRGGVLAAQMAVEDFGGKVLGAPIEVISGDHQNKPDVGAGIARLQSSTYLPHQSLWPSKMSRVKRSGSF